MIKQSCLKLVAAGCILIFIEAIIRAAWSAFPFLEAVSPQVALISAYVAGKITQDIKEKKYTNENTQK